MLKSRSGEATTPLYAPPYCNMQSPSQIISCSLDYFPAALCPVDVFRNREYNICI